MLKTPLKPTETAKIRFCITCPYDFKSIKGRLSRNLPFLYTPSALNCNINEKNLGLADFEF